MSNEGPARILYDEAGNRVGVSTNPFQVTGFVNVDRVGVTGPVRVDAVGVTGPVGVTGQVSVVGPVGVTGPVRVDSVGVTGPVRVDAVGGTGPFRVDAVGITGFVQATGPIGVTGLVSVVGAVGGTGPFRVDAVGGTGPFRVDAVGVTGPVRVDRVGITGFVQVTGPIGVTGQIAVVGPVTVQGGGTPGVATGGVLSVQGVDGPGVPVNVMGTGPFRVDAVGGTGPFRVDRVGITGYVQATGPIGVTGLVQVVGAVGVTGPVRVDSVGVTGYAQVTGPIGVTGLVSVVGAVGGTGPFRVDSVGGTGPFRVDTSGVTGPVFMAGFGTPGVPTAGVLSVQGVTGGLHVPVAQGQAVGPTGAWPVGIADGVNVASVKAASTVPTATDRAIVVVLSPNQQSIPVSSTPATSTAGLSFGTITLGGGSSGTLNAIRATAYTEQSSNAQRSISSASANDTAAGTGARTVRITYFDSTGAGPFTETVVMNGVTPVNTSSSTICYIEKLEVLTAGSLSTNSGVITLFVSTGGGGGTIGTIGTGNVVTATGDGRTLWCHHYVATGKMLSITGVVVAGSSPATFHVRVKSPISSGAEIITSELITALGSFERTYGSPISVSGPARVTMYGVPSTNGVSMNASMDYFET